MVKEKEIKIILKEVQSVHSVQRKVASCEACRKRKQRCEGDPPCKHCIFKGIPCVFLNRRHKKPDSDYVAEHSGDSSDSEGSNSENNELALAAKENMLISTLEIRKYVDFFMRFDHFSALFDKDKLLAPPNIAFETQAYAVGAFSAHYCGEYAVARQCLEKARFLAGSIFDSPTVEAVSAIVLMSNCWKKVLEHSMSSHYAKIGWNLLSSMGWYKLFAVPNPPLLVYAHTCQIFCRYDDTMSDKKKAKILFEKAEYLKQQSTDKNLLDHMHLLTMRTYAKVIKYIGSFIFFPTDTSTVMYNLDNLRIDETARTSIMEEISALEKHATQLGVHSGFHAQHNVVLIIRTVHLLTEWKSGNLEAAAHLARFCLDVCRLVQNQSRICTADFSHFCLLGVTVQFLCSIGNFDEALELCEHIKYTSELLGPLYKFIPGVVDKDVKMLRQKYLHPTLQHADFTTTTNTTNTTTTAANNATTQQFLNVQQQQQIANYYNIHYNNPNFFNLQQNYNNNVNITNSINLMNATCPTTTTTTTSESGQTCAQQGMDTMASNRFLNFVNFVNSNQQVPDTTNFNFNPHLLNPASFNSSIASASAPKTSPPMMIDGIRHGLFLNSQNPQQVFVNPFHPSTSVFAPVAAPFQQPHSPQHPNPVFAPSPSNPHSPQHPNPVFAPSPNNPHSPQHPNPVFAPSSTNPHSPPHPASSVFAPSPTSHSQSPTPFLPTSGQAPSLFPAAPSQNPVFASNEPPGEHPYDGHPYMPGKLAKSVNQGLNPRHSNYVTTVYSEDQIDEV